jgi:hypothetical protein
MYAWTLSCFSCWFTSAVFTNIAPLRFWLLLSRNGGFFLLLLPLLSFQRKQKPV